MKLVIKIKLHNKDLTIKKYGDWIDLCAGKTTDIPVDSFRLISLDVSMKLPKGFEAYVVPRSSTFKYFNVLQTNSIGIIDNSYCGNNDIWKFPAFNPTKNTVRINEGERICQFRIMLSQDASVWTKLKWLFSSGIKIVEVLDLKDPNRGGFGSTGK